MIEIQTTVFQIHLYSNIKMSAMHISAQNIQTFIPVNWKDEDWDTALENMYRIE